MTPGHYSTGVIIRRYTGMVFWAHVYLLRLEVGTHDFGIYRSLASCVQLWRWLLFGYGLNLDWVWINLKASAWLRNDLYSAMGTFHVFTCIRFVHCNAMYNDKCLYYLVAWKLFTSTLWRILSPQIKDDIRRFREFSLIEKMRPQCDG